MATLIVDNMRNGYIEIIEHVLEHGEKVAPRGQTTYEILAPTIVLTNPRDALPLGIGRGLNLKIAAVEACQLIAGRGYPQLVLAASPNFATFAEDDSTFHGNYGERAQNQIRSIYRKLKDDPSSRQAVMTLWNPLHDNLVGKRDYPCTVGFQFLIRNDLLTMITTMRSNDAWLGLAYDAFQFTQLQQTIARMLGVGVGQYVHQPGSLHVYERDLEAIDALTSDDDPEPRYNPRGIGRSDAQEYEVEARDRAIALLNGDPIEMETVSEKWYRVQLDALREKVGDNG